MKILVFGLGFVGSVAAVALSKSGHHITAVDINREKINSLKQGQITIKEPGLIEIIQDSLKNTYLEFQYLHDIENINESVAMICVGTPSKADGDGKGKPDHSNWHRAIFSRRHIKMIME
jgi:UDP-glucose 6-dehydrogenase